jgi:microcystin-dependent protein
MAQPYIGQILTFAGNFAPLGYLLCNGQSLSISQNDVLFQLIGTTYGGDGVNTFNLPNLQGRTPIHMGQGPGLGNYVIGQIAGTEGVTLISQQLPQHNHFVAVVTGIRSSSAQPATNAVLGDMGPSQTTSTNTYLPYAASGQTALAPQSITITGQGNAHENRQPYLAITYAIAVQGIYPAQP